MKRTRRETFWERKSWGVFIMSVKQAVGVGLVLALGSASMGCRDRESQKVPSPVREDSGRTEEPVVPSARAQVDPCEELLDELLGQPQVPGTPKLDAERAHLMARARAVPLLFWRSPIEDPSLSHRVREFRNMIRDAEFPAEAIQKVLHKTRGKYAERRAIFLTENYLFADTPLLALRLSQIIRLDHLFSEPEVLIQRGDRFLVARREEGRYFLPPQAKRVGRREKTPQTGELASLLLFDRVRLPSETFGPVLHFDLASMQRALGFSTAKTLAFTREHLALSLETEGVKSLAIFKTSVLRTEEAAVTLPGALAEASGSALGGDGNPDLSGGVRGAGETGHLSLLCESVHRRHASDDFEQARQNALEDRALVEPVLRAAWQMIERRLPFDEPRTEEGQQDGLLRMHFRQAYRRYRSTYEFNGDSYYVFDGYGRVRLPQVCIDFITDAFDWGTGGSWPSRGERRMRTKGALNFSGLGIENPRSIESLLEYASATPAWFDVIWFEKERRVKFMYREKFFRQLALDANLYRLGDVVFIYGLRDDGKFHYHSFLIGEKDPMTGMPILVMSNAGPPQARSWEGEMQNAPLRSIVARMRVRREVLAEAREQARLRPGEPLDPPPTEYQIPEKKPGSESETGPGLPAL